MLYSSLESLPENGVPAISHLNTKTPEQRSWGSTLAPILGLLVFTVSAEAHLSGESYAFLRFADGALHVRADLPMARVSEVVNIEAARGEPVSEAQVSARLAEIIAYIDSHLQLKAPDTRFTPTYREHELWPSPTGQYLSVSFYQPNVGNPPDVIEARYELFLEDNPEHRGILELLPADATESDAENGRILGVFAPGRTLQTVRLSADEPSTLLDPSTGPRRRGALMAGVALALSALLALAMTARRRHR